MRLLHISVVLLVSGIWPASALAATVEQARRPSGSSYPALKLEGTIEPGDTDKLLAALRASTEEVRYIYLMSKGGDVEEAIKMGTLIRRLRLGTHGPDKIGNYSARCPVALASDTNCVCASACFLIFAGGANRMGNYYALHRPYLSKQTAARMSDLEHEAAQKQAMAKVRNYLQQMEVDQFFIEKVMSNSSQDAYLVTSEDAVTYHLEGLVPSIQEIVLTKCNVATKQDWDLHESILHKGAAATPEELHLKLQLQDKILAGSNCSSEMLGQLQRAAYIRELYSDGKVP